MRAVARHFGALAAVETPFAAIADPVERNDAIKRAALDYALTHPTQYLERAIDRMARFWSPMPGSKKPMVNVIAFAATIPFYIGAAVSLILLRQRWRSLLPILIPIAFLFALHAATHALPRYRLPLDPLLMVLASGWFALVAQALWTRAGPPARCAVR